MKIADSLLTALKTLRTEGDEFTLTMLLEHMAGTTSTIQVMTSLNNMRRIGYLTSVKDPHSPNGNRIIFRFTGMFDSSHPVSFGFLNQAPVKPSSVEVKKTQEFKTPTAKDSTTDQDRLNVVMQSWLMNNLKPDMVTSSSKVLNDLLKEGLLPATYNHQTVRNYANQYLAVCALCGTVSEIDYNSLTPSEALKSGPYNHLTPYYRVHKAPQAISLLKVNGLKDMDIFFKQKTTEEILDMDPKARKHYGIQYAIVTTVLDQNRLWVESDDIYNICKKESWNPFVNMNAVRVYLTATYTLYGLKTCRSPHNSQRQAYTLTTG